MADRVEPVASYRFQLTPTFGFDDVVDRLDHVRALGCSHVYLSPIAQSVPDSTHGYDVVDHTQVRAEFGGSDGFDRLLTAVAARGLAVIIDHVPNHVSAARPDLNPTWWSLLRDGKGSAGADWFDVDWAIADDRVILPVLGGPLADVIAAGDVVVRDGAVMLYGERRLPLRAGTADLPIDELVDAQHYRLQDWRTPERNVRRFFTVDDLVAVRVELAHVAEVVDTLPTRAAGRPGFGGVRVDHIDGLADPEGYLVALRERIGEDALLYVEKILAPGEHLPGSWPVDGTTGYEFITAVDHLLLAGSSETVLDTQWRSVSGDRRVFHQIEAIARDEVVHDGLAPDTRRLVRQAAGALDVPPADVDDEVRALAVGLACYRTYLPGDERAESMVHAISLGPVAEAILDPSDEGRRAVRTRWQQLTGPVSAKAAEDRAFYRYLRLPSLCEVGGDPGGYGMGADRFHAENLARLDGSPLGMLASSTHDTKRSEDVRARSTALTWLAADAPDATSAQLDALVHEITDGSDIDGPTAWLAAHTVLTTPGLDHPRFLAYLTKAARESALHTAWGSPDEVYEALLDEIAGRALSASSPLGRRIDAIAPGISLAATALRLTSPGMPDVYQGAEAFTFRLVDPDNRVPPDWPALERDAQDERSACDLWADNDPGVKTVLIRDVLALRRRRSGSFAPGSAYRPIEVGDGAVAYGRGDDVVVAIRRGTATVEGSLEFPPGAWFDVLDPLAPTLSGTVAAASVVGSGDDQTLPVAVFERE